MTSQGEIRKKENFSDFYQKIFASLSIQGKSRLIGSSAVVGILYNNDYDLAENIQFRDEKHVREHILELFIKKFEDALKEPDTFITDFKCGEQDGKALRWTYEDLKKGYKCVSGKKIHFVDRIMQKKIMKMDKVVLTNGIFTEFTENYYFTIGDEKNYNPEDSTTKNLSKAIITDGYKYWSDGKYFKALKRLYSYLRLVKKGKRIQNRLVDIFNSQIGLVYKGKADLETIHLVLTQKFKPFDREHIINNLQLIKQSLENVGKLDLKDVHIGRTIDKICKLKSLATMSKMVESLSHFLLDVVNDNTKDFLADPKNKDLKDYFVK